MDELLAALITCNYEIAVEDVEDAWWTATVTRVKDTHTSLVATFGGFTRTRAYDNAVKFLRDRPR